jgi:hypothetical protein
LSVTRVLTKTVLARKLARNALLGLLLTKQALHHVYLALLASTNLLLARRAALFVSFKVFLFTGLI